MEVEAKFDDEQGIFEQKVAQLFGVDLAFFDAQQKGFEVGRDEMTVRAATSEMSCLSLINSRPVEQGKESTIVLDKRINIEHGGEGGLVEMMRCRYHNQQFLCVSRMSFLILCTKEFSCDKRIRSFLLQERKLLKQEVACSIVA